MAEILLSPVGRLVQGDPFKAQDKDQKGNLRVVKSGPNAGQPNPQFFIAVAYSKTDPVTQAEWGPYRARLDQIAKVSFPLLFPDTPLPGQPLHLGAGGGTVGCTHPSFAWKIIDGDGYDDSGQPWSKREGFAGHWVVRYSSGYAPKVYPVGRHSPLDQITAEQSHLVRRGYYVRVSSGVESNGDVSKPGLYQNLNMLELVGQGPEIRGGVDASQAFGAPVALPAGATALPGSPPPAPVTAPAVAAPLPPVPAPAPIVAAPPPPVSAPPVTVSRTMTPAATGTYEQYVAAGWTEAQLIAGGLLAV